MLAHGPGDHVTKKAAFILPCKLGSPIPLLALRKEAAMLENKHSRQAFEVSRNLNDLQVMHSQKLEFLVLELKRGSAGGFNLKRSTPQWSFSAGLQPGEHVNRSFAEDPAKFG